MFYLFFLPISSVYSAVSDTSLLPFRDVTVVKLDVFGEARCPDTTRFLQTQLLPVLMQLPQDRVQIYYHPMGIHTSCTAYGGRLECQCHHGDLECLMNQLQSCIVAALPNPSDHLPIVVCIQGKGSFEDAVNTCLYTNPHPGLDVDFMIRCAASDLGKHLMLKHALIQYDIAPKINWVPWVIINGVRVRAAEYRLLKTLCDEYLIPQPIECQIYGQYQQ